MALITVTHELKHLMMAHHLERTFTTDTLSELRTNYRSTEGSQRVTISVFLRAVGNASRQQLTYEVVQTYFSDGDLKQWFISLDEDYDGLVDWNQLFSEFSKVAAMRRHPIMMAPKVRQLRWQGPPVDGCLYIDTWKRLAVWSSANSNIELLSPAGTHLSNLTGHSAYVLCIRYLRGLGKLCSTGCDRNLMLWDHKRVTPFHQVQLPTPASCLTYNPAECQIIVALLDGSLQCYSQDLKSLIWTSSSKHDDWVKDMVFIGELRLIVTASLDRTIGMWSHEGDLVTRKAGHSRSVTCLAYSYTTRTLISGGQGKEVMVWNPFSPLPTPIQVLHGHEREVVGIFADLLNKCFLTVDAGTRVVVWDSAKYNIVSRVEHPDAGLQYVAVKGCCLNPVNREVTMIGQHFYKSSALLTETRPPKLGTALRHLHFAPDFNCVICVTATHVYFFNTNDGELIRTIEQPFGPVLIEASTLCGSRLFVTSGDGRVVRYTLEEGETSRIYKIRARRVLHMFDNAVTHVFLCKLGYAFAESDGSLSVFSVKEDSQGIMLGVISSMKLRSGAAGRTIVFSQIHDCCAVAHRRNFSIWRPARSTLERIDTAQPARKPGSGTAEPATQEDPKGELVTLTFMDHRATLFALFKKGIIVGYNIGSFTECLTMTDVREACVLSLGDKPKMGRSFSGSFNSSLNGSRSLNSPKNKHGGGPLKLDATVRGSFSGSLNQLGSRGDLSAQAHHYHLRTLSHSYDDCLTFTGDKGMIATVPTTGLFATFFANQKGGLLAIEDDDECTVHNTNFAVVPVTPETMAKYTSGLHTKLLPAVDRRHNEPALLKLWTDGKGHAAEVATRAKFPMDSPFLVRYLSTWDSNEGLSRGTAERGIAMELGATVLRDLLRSWEKPDPMTASLNIRRTRSKTHVASAGKSGEHPEPTADLKDTIILQLMHILQVIHSKDMVSTDFRPRHIVQVKDQWKLCGLDNLVPAGSRAGIHYSPNYCPPELAGTCLLDRGAKYAPVADPSMNLWSLGCIVFEMETGYRLFEGNNKTVILKAVNSVTEGRLEREVRISSSGRPLAQLVMEVCLRPQPEDRGTIDELLEMANDRGYALDPEALQSATGVTSTDEGTTLPDEVSDTMKPATASAADLGAIINEVPRAGDFVKVDCHTRRRLLLCADVSNGDGSVFLVNSLTTESLGLLPRSELGEDNTCMWSWPRDGEGRAQADDNDAEGGNNASPHSARDVLDGVGGAKLGSEAHLTPLEGEHAKHSKTIAVPTELHPPKGWKAMDSDQLAATLVELSPKRRREGIISAEDEAVETFIRNIINQSSFFGAGPKDGVVIPKYAPEPIRRMSPLDYQKLMSQRQDEERRKRSQRFQKDLRAELEAQGLKRDQIVLHEPQRVNAKEILAQRKRPDPKRQELINEAMAHSVPSAQASNYAMKMVKENGGMAVHKRDPNLISAPKWERQVASVQKHNPELDGDLKDLLRGGLKATSSVERRRELPALPSDHRLLQRRSQKRNQ